MSLSLNARELDTALMRTGALSKNWLSVAPEELHALIRSVVARIGGKQLADALGSPVNADNVAGSAFVLEIAAELRRAGQGKRFVIGKPYQDTGSAALIEFLKEAFAARHNLLVDTDETLNEITARSTKSKGRLKALMRVSYLAPDIVTDILAGHHPPELSVKRLVRMSQDRLSIGAGSARSWAWPEENSAHGSRSVPESAHP